MARGARLGHPRHLEPQPEERGRGRRLRPLPRRRRGARLQVDHRDGRRSGDRCALDLRAESQARREPRGDRRGAGVGQGHAQGHRVREASRAQCRRGPEVRRAHQARGCAARLPRGSVVHARVDEGPGAELGARRRDCRSPLPRARGRGAQRAAHAVVLAGRAAGRRRAQRHDVPQRRGRALLAQRSEEAAQQHPAREGHRPHPLAQVVAPGIREDAQAHDGPRGGLREASVRGFRARDDRVCRRGGPHAHR